MAPPSTTWLFGNWVFLSLINYYRYNLILDLSFCPFILFPSGRYNGHFLSHSLTRLKININTPLCASRRWHQSLASWKIQVPFCMLAHHPFLVLIFSRSSPIIIMLLLLHPKLISLHLTSCLLSYYIIHIQYCFIIIKSYPALTFIHEIFFFYCRFT